MKRILSLSALVGLIALGIYYPIVWWIIGIAIVVIIALIYFVLNSYDKTHVTRGQARCDMNKVLKLGCGCSGIFFLMFLLFASWLIVDTYKSYNHDPDIASRKEAIDTSVKVEKLTGFKLPEYDVVKYKSSGYTFFGDFADTIVVRFRSATIDDVQHLLEESAVFHITSDSTGYDHINNERDFAIKITLDKKSNTGEIMLFNGLVPAS